MSESGHFSFEEWATARQHALLRSAYLVTGDLPRAEDLVQEALLKVCLRWERLRTGSPDAYARRIVYRSNISWWRSRREVTVESVGEPRSPHDPDAQDRPLVVRAALMRLTIRQRAVLVLRYYDDLTEQQTAAVLGVSVGSVKKHASMARQRLRDIAPELAELADGREQTP
jgi:RNA polymerase sigma-70 factor (sigma-E family)